MGDDLGTQIVDNGIVAHTCPKPNSGVGMGLALTGTDAGESDNQASKIKRSGFSFTLVRSCKNNILGMIR